MERSAEALAGAITALSNDAPLRQSVGTANRQHAAAMFDERVMLGAYASLYAGALGLAPAQLWRDYCAIMPSNG